MIMENKNENQASLPFANMESAVSHAPLGTQKGQGLDTPCRIHIHSRRHRLTDPDGISAKAAIDGIVIAGILPDDTAKQIKEITFSQEKIPKSEIEETIIELIEKET